MPIRHIAKCCLVLIACFTSLSVLVAQESESAPAPPDINAITSAGGSIAPVPAVDGDSLKLTARSTLVTFPQFDSTRGRLSFDAHFPRGGSIWIALGSKMPESPKSDHALAAVQISNTLRGGGLTMGYMPLEFDEETRKWENRQTEGRTISYWPRGRRDQQSLSDAGFEKPDFEGRWFSFELKAVDQRSLEVWVDDEIMLAIPFDGDRDVVPMVIDFSKNSHMRNVKVDTFERDARWEPLVINGIARATAKEHVGSQTVELDDVPYRLVDSGAKYVDVSSAKWTDLPDDPSRYFAAYDAGARFEDDPDRLVVRVPHADYTAAHLLAYAVDDDETWPGVTIQAGRFAERAGRGQLTLRRFTSTLPRRSDSETDHPSMNTKAGKLYSVRIPMTRAFKQDVMTGVIDLELTRQIRLAVRSPDPARYRYRPIGLPSGARVFAITLEKSPLQMHVSSNAAGHAFEQPGEPVFNVTLDNISDRSQSFTLVGRSEHLDGETFENSIKGELKAHATKTFNLTMPYQALGYHCMKVRLLDNEDNVLLERPTSFAMLPKDTRKHRDTAPFGTWDFSGGHITSRDPELLGELYRKAGLRYGMFGIASEIRTQFGVRQGREPRVHREDAVEYYAKWFADNPDAPNAALLMHENSVSGAQVMRAPSMFTDRGKYEFDEKEQERFDHIWNLVNKGATEIREQYPQVHLRLGNGPLPTKEAFLERGFSPDLFDSAGNESAVFGRPPEAQPPEWVGNNSGIWMDRQMLDHYGYGDKAVTQCFETCYPSSNPGNLSYRAQADFFARHYLHALAWELPHIRYGIIMDVGNSYFYGNWGSAGFCFQMPDVSVKPAYVSIATLTRVLDGAKYQGTVDMGTKSLFALQFSRPDGKTVYAIWSPDNKYSIIWSASKGADWLLVDSQGNAASAKTDDDVSAMVSGSPKYLVGQGSLSLKTVDMHSAPELDQSIKTSNVVDLGSLENWQVSTERDLELETHNGLTPRRQGDFAFDPVETFQGRESVLRVTPKPIDHGTKYMPMYGIIEHNEGIALPGKPTEIGIWVNGNASWGRIIYELVDARGERFLSIGASKSGGASTWMLDWMPAEMAEQRGDLSQADWNTNDVFGLSRFSFEGWRLVRFPLPGNYPGEKFHWPYSSQWKHTDDDVVDYPLKLKRIIVELPENTLHLKDYSPVKRKEVYLDNIVVIHGDDNWLAPDGPQYDRKAHGSR